MVVQRRANLSKMYVDPMNNNEIRKLSIAAKTETSPDGVRQNILANAHSVHEECSSTTPVTINEQNIEKVKEEILPDDYLTKRPMLQYRETSGKYSLGDFQILRTLGTGSFGRVHLIRSNHNGRFYALKTLKKHTIVKLKQVEHTNDERRMLSIVSHPFIIRMWGTFQDSQQVFMVMDYIEGGELFSLLRKSQRFPNPCQILRREVLLSLGIFA